MSDLSMSKAAKKNAKRRATKRKEKGAASATSTGPGKYLTYKEILKKLQEELEQTKLEKDHPRAGKLRDQIWVVTDLVAGVRTDIPRDEMLEILQSVNIGPEADEATEKSEPSKPIPLATNLTTEEKKIRSLKKKLQQIDALREREKKGEKLELSQIEKIQSEEKIKEEIEELEDLLESALSLH